MSDDQRYLKLALGIAGLSEDPSMQVGAVLIGRKGEYQVIGYNQFPFGVKADIKTVDRETKLSLVVHAEMVALLNCARFGFQTLGSTMYMISKSATNGEVHGGAPCTRCTVELLQAGVKTIVCGPSSRVPDRWKESCEYAKNLLIEAGVEYREVEFA